jgi:hypothetical protein
MPGNMKKMRPNKRKFDLSKVPEEKECGLCRGVLPRDQFLFDGRTKDGLSVFCRICRPRVYKKMAGDEAIRGHGGALDGLVPSEENKRFSASGDPPDVAPTVPEADLGGLPAPSVTSLPESVPVMAQIEDDKLKCRILRFLETLLQGGKHKTAMLETDMTWNNWVHLRRRYKGLNELWLTCRDLGDEFRRILRLDAAHERAVDGVDDPIYSNSGKYLGSRKLYSDRLLELLLKADNPDKFSDKSKVEVVGTTIHIGIGFDRDKLKAEEAAKNAEDAEFEVVDDEKPGPAS